MRSVQISHTGFTAEFAIGASFAIESVFGVDIQNNLEKKLLQDCIKQ